MPRKLRIGIVDLVTNVPSRALWTRVMHGNFASIMPQVVAVWCQQAGHHVTYVCYTGLENLADELPEDADIIFIGGFTESAQLAYALSHMLQARGAVTVLGGPHARAYPQDAQKYFDYVLGFTDHAIIDDILRDAAPHRPIGRHLSAVVPPRSLPGVRERWPFVRHALARTRVVKMVPVLASVGCPYTCSFCVDASVPYQLLDLEVLKDDLRFLLTKFKRPLVAFHDPNFAVKFDACLDAIEDAVPPGSIDFAAESSLAILSERHLARLQRNGCRALLPGIESWYELGMKSGTGSSRGIDKVRHVADHVNTILRHIPYVQTNFVFGLDTDEGDEPFELTKRFVEAAPGAYPGYSFLTAFGGSAPANGHYQQEGRILPFPFHFINNNGTMNVLPKHYGWSELYRRAADLTRHSFSLGAVARRAAATRTVLSKSVNVMRAFSTQGRGRIAAYLETARLADGDPQTRAFLHRDTTRIPDRYAARIRADLGPFWQWLPPGALEHDPAACLGVIPPPAAGASRSKG